MDGSRPRLWPDAVLSHWSAAALWLIRPNSRTMIDVTVPRKGRSWKGIRRHYSLLPADERTIEEGIPVTTVPRTILDLAATEISRHRREPPARVRIPPTL